MLRAALLLALASAVLGQPVIRPWIEKGNRPDVGTFPAQVALSLKGVLLCGGTLIDDVHVLTTAECVKNITQETDLSVTGGVVQLDKVDPTPQTRFAKKIYWVNKTLGYQYGKVKKIEEGDVSYPIDDIVLIRLSDRFIITGAVKAIEVATENATQLTKCQVSGWGATSEASLPNPSKTLFSTDVLVHDVGKCMMGLQLMDNANITNASHVCIQPVGLHPLCKGDEGSGIICNGKLQGILSWGLDCWTTYSIGVNIVPYEQWIKNAIKESNMQFGNTSTTPSTKKPETMWRIDVNSMSSEVVESFNRTDGFLYLRSSRCIRRY